jgi:hypothetical protein
MNAKERASLAEQLLSNPMFAELFDGVERNAIEAMIAARDDATRARSAMRVQAIRDLRSDCQNSLRDTTPRRVVA